MNIQKYGVPIIKTLTTVIIMCTSFSLSANQVCQTDDMELTSPTSQYILHNDGTVTDINTSLMWQVCSAESNERDENQCETPAQYTWEKALNYIVEFNGQHKLAGYTDWRLPNIRELATLAELQCTRPAINLTIFPNTPAAHYWSSSPYKFYPHYSWYMNFEDGVYTYGDRTDSKHIRLVRDIGS